MSSPPDPGTTQLMIIALNEGEPALSYHCVFTQCQILLFASLLKLTSVFPTQFPFTQSILFVDKITSIYVHFTVHKEGENVQHNSNKLA